MVFSKKQRASLVAQMVKNLSTVGETWVNPWVGKIPWRKERQRRHTKDNIEWVAWWGIPPQVIMHASCRILIILATSLAVLVGVYQTAIAHTHSKNISGLKRSRRLFLTHEEVD